MGNEGDLRLKALVCRGRPNELGVFGQCEWAELVVAPGDRSICWFSVIFAVFLKEVTCYQLLRVQGGLNIYVVPKIVFLRELPAAAPWSRWCGVT